MRETLPRKRRRGESENEVISVYGPKRLWRELEKIAAQTDRNRSELVVGAVEKWVAAWREGFHGKPRR
jgi:metal-responsive CopG/Arc/MetJ family transcriptional regulator